MSFPTSFFDTLTDRRSYNSAFLPTIASSSYTWAVVTPGFITGAPYDINTTVQAFQGMLDDKVAIVEDWAHVPDWEHPPATIERAINQSFDAGLVGGTWIDYQAAKPFNNPEILRSMQDRISRLNDSGPYIKLNKSQCVQQYQGMLNNMSNVLLVSSATPPSNSSVLWFGAAGLHDGADMMSQWLTKQSNNFSVPRFGPDKFPGTNDDERTRNMQFAMSGWNVGGFTIDYCLASQIDLDDKCAISFSQDFLIGKRECKRSKYVGTHSGVSLTSTQWSLSPTHSRFSSLR